MVDNEKVVAEYDRDIPDHIEVRSFLRTLGEQFEEDVEDLEEGETLEFGLTIGSIEDGYYAEIEEE